MNSFIYADINSMRSKTSISLAFAFCLLAACNNSVNSSFPSGSNQIANGVSENRASGNSTQVASGDKALPNSSEKPPQDAPEITPDKFVGGKFHATDLPPGACDLTLRVVQDTGATKFLVTFDKPCGGAVVTFTCSARFCDDSNVMRLMPYSADGLDLRVFAQGISGIPARSCGYYRDVPKPPAPQLVQKDTGAKFMLDTSRSELGTAYRDPSGVIWGEIVKSANGTPKQMNLEDATAHCNSLGDRLPSWDEMKSLARYFGNDWDEAGQLCSPITKSYEEILPGILKEADFWSSAPNPYGPGAGYVFESSIEGSPDHSCNDFPVRSDSLHDVRCVYGPQ